MYPKLRRKEPEAKLGPSGSQHAISGALEQRGGTKWNLCR